MPSEFQSGGLASSGFAQHHLLESFTDGEFPLESEQFKGLGS